MLQYVYQGGTALTFDNFADKLSRLSWAAPHADAGLVPHRLTLLVHTDQGHRIHEGEQN